MFKQHNSSTQLTNYEQYIGDGDYDMYKLHAPCVSDKKTVKSVIGAKQRALIMKSKNKFSKRGMSIVTTSWDDVQRFNTSCWGSNISDCSLATMCGNTLPIVKLRDNFEDQVSIMPSGKIYMIVGNAVCGGDLKTISLKTYLNNVGKSEPSLENPDMSLYCRDLDDAVAIRYQTVLVPGNAAELQPVVYNYQTTEDNPKNLIALSCHLGTTAHLNKPGKQLLALRTVRDKKVVNTTIKVQRDTDDGKLPKKTVLGTKHMGTVRNTIMFIQIPLVQRNDEFGSFGSFASNLSFDAPVYRSMSPAYVDHGKTLGAFSGHGMSTSDIERDTYQPITITVTTYVSTNGEITDLDVDKVYRELTEKHQCGDWVGSIVTQTPNETLAGKSLGKCPHSAPQLNEEYVRLLSHVSSSSTNSYPDY
jgi:hypothetical protein